MWVVLLILAVIEAMAYLFKVYSESASTSDDLRGYSPQDVSSGSEAYSIRPEASPR
jgi:hypothetical protein